MNAAGLTPINCYRLETSTARVHDSQVWDELIHGDEASVWADKGYVSAEREAGFGFGLEYVLLQRAALGCKVDGGQHKMGSYTHPDAEVIAATVAGMPDSLGGIRMAIRVAELARAGLTSDWMPGVVPRCVPVETKQNQHGERATTVVVRTERVLTRGKWRTVEVLACPVTWRPHPKKIASARRGYEDWWQALDWVRDGLVVGRMLREVEVTAAMHKARPWGSW